MPERIYSNTAVFTSLTGNAVAGATTLNVGSTTGWPTPGAGEVGVGAIDYGDQSLVEVFTYTGKTATTLTGVTRGVDGTTDQLHTSGARVRHVMSSEDIENSARINKANTFTEDQTIEDQNHLALADIGSLHGFAGVSGSVIWSRNARWNGSASVRRVADTDAARVILADDGSLVFETSTDAGNTVGSTITWEEKFRIGKSGIVTAYRDSAALDSIRAGVSGEAVLRFGVKSDGKVEWGDGVSARDTNLFRASAGRLRTDSLLSINGTDSTYSARAGTPEGNITANPGSVCQDVTNGVLYVKKTGTGNTGWVALAEAPTLIIKPSNEDAGLNNVLQNDDHLVAPVAANSVYRFRGILFPSNPTSDNQNQRHRWVPPAGATLRWGATYGSASTAVQARSAVENEDITVSTYSLSVMAMPYEGILRTGGTAGNLQLQWTNASGVVGRMGKDSTLEITKV